MKTKRHEQPPVGEFREYQVLPPEKVFAVRRKILRRLAESLTRKPKSRLRNSLQR
jgi:hypothetical protein